MSIRIELRGLERLSPTQRRLLEVLLDGESHYRRELIRCLYDPNSGAESLKVHLSQLRSRIRPYGLDILCEYHGARRQSTYRLVMLISRSEPD